MPITPQQQTDQGHSSLWWPSFDTLYEALREACMSDASYAVLSLDALLTASQFWLEHSLLGFLPPSEAAKAQLERGEHIHAADSKRMPIVPALKSLALQLSEYLVSLKLHAMYAPGLVCLICCASQQPSSPDCLRNLLTSQSRCRTSMSYKPTFSSGGGTAVKQALQHSCLLSNCKSCRQHTSCKEAICCAALKNWWHSPVPSSMHSTPHKL